MLNAVSAAVVTYLADMIIPRMAAAYKEEFLMDKLNEMNARLAEVAEDNYPVIYHMQQLTGHMWEQYFSQEAEQFNGDEHAKNMYVRSYGFIMAQLHVLSDELFRIRVDIELALGIENDQTRARIKNAKKSWAHMEIQGEEF